MKQLLLVIAALMTLSSYAQFTEHKHFYEYDDSGNRIRRIYELVEVEEEEQGTWGKKDVEDPNEPLGITAYPNPFSEQVTIRLDASHEFTGDEQIDIYSQNGQLIQEIKMAQNSKTINTKDLANGTYMVRLSTGVETRQFILVKN